MTVVPDTPGRRLGGTGTAPLERRGTARPQAPDEAAGEPKVKGLRRRRKEDAQADPKGKVAATEAKGKDPKGKKKDEAEEGEKKGGKKKLILVLLVVVVLAAGLYVVKFRHHKVIYKKGEPVPNGKVVSIGTITANTADGHLVQAGIDLQLTVVANSKQEAQDSPQLNNAAIGDLTNWTYAQLLTGTGRTGLQAQLLKSFQQILGTTDGAAEQVSAVYFTSFILQ
jgi:flagellar protein FliL